MNMQMREREVRNRQSEKEEENRAVAKMNHFYKEVCCVIIIKDFWYLINTGHLTFPPLWSRLQLVGEFLF